MRNLAALFERYTYRPVVECKAQTPPDRSVAASQRLEQGEVRVAHCFAANHRLTAHAWQAVCMHASSMGLPPTGCWLPHVEQEQCCLRKWHTVRIKATDKATDAPQTARAGKKLRLDGFCRLNDAASPRRTSLHLSRAKPLRSRPRRSCLLVRRVARLLGVPVLPSASRNASNFAIVLLRLGARSPTKTRPKSWP